MRNARDDQWSVNAVFRRWCTTEGATSTNLFDRTDDQLPLIKVNVVARDLRAALIRAYCLP